MPNIHVCFASDQNFSFYLRFAVVSLLCSAAEDDRLHLHVLSHGISQASKDRLQSLLAELRPDASLDFAEFSYDAFQALTVLDPAMTPATYGRLLIPQTFPDVATMIYLDVDLIVTGSLAALWTTPLDGFALGAVDDPAKDLAYHAIIGLNPNHYFNAGVLLMDCEKWRREGISESILALGHGKKYRYADQDMLNLYFEGKTKFLDPVWNALSVQKRPAGTKVFHYAGQKPWHTPEILDAKVFWDVAMRLPEGKELRPEIAAQIRLFPSAKRRLKLGKYRLLAYSGYKKEHYDRKIELFRQAVRLQMRLRRYFKEK